MKSLLFDRDARMNEIIRRDYINIAKRCCKRAARTHFDDNIIILLDLALEVMIKATNI